MIDDEVKEKIKFLDDPTIRTRVVNKTCERCPITDCEERAAPAIEVKKKENRKAVQDALKKLIGE